MTNENEIEFVRQIASALYSRRVEIEPLDSHNNRVYRLCFGEGTSKRIFKMAGTHEKAAANVLREQQALKAVAAVGLPVPTIEFTQEDNGLCARPFFIMNELPGVNLNTTWRTEFAWAEGAWKRAGRFVADLKNIPIASVESILEPNPTHFDGIREALDKHGYLRRPFDTLIDAAQALGNSRESVFLHGDYSSGQVIADGISFGVVDWEHCHLGARLDALGRMNAMTREYGGQEKHIQWAIEGYEETQPLSEMDRHALHVYEMLNHIGVMSWKLGWLPDHDKHAREMARRVEEWTLL